MAIHGVFESTNMHSTRYGCVDALVEAPIDNGNVGYVEGGKFKAFTAELIGKKQVVVLDQPAWNYEECSIVNQRKDAFQIEAGVIARARNMYLNDKFGLNAAAIEGTPVVGKYLVLAAGSTKLVVADSIEGAAFACEIVEERTNGMTLVTEAHTYGYAYPMYIAKVVVNNVAA